MPNWHSSAERVRDVVEDASLVDPGDPLHPVPSMEGRRRGREPHRVLLLGDTHGSVRWIGRAARAAAAMGVDGIVQLGDFGYLPGDRWERQFLAYAERLL